ncbi:MAG: NADH-dependent flavin oxidoreductase [Caldilineaceae bacterium]|nr:NADH-dependent flavin oxidoreductase [Caldilineaceae bacterium]
MTIFDPFTLPISGISLPNRLALAPMTTYSSHEDGTITDEEVAYLRRRAAGGFGTIITAACYVERVGQGFVGQWACDDDRHLPSLARAAQAIKDEGAVALLQIHDAGRMSDPRVIDWTPRSASDIPAERPNALQPRPMSQDEIMGSVAAFAAAARRAVQAGFDGVEIHGANTYLLQQFFSPHSNRREDDWGGDLQRRMRFPLAVARAVRRAVGDNVVVGYRFSPEEAEEPGITIEDTFALVDALCELNLDYLHLSLRDYNLGSLRDESDTRPRLKLIADRIAGRVPLMGVGSVWTAADAEGVLDSGAALVAVGRAALTEPEWPNRIRQGQDIRTCVPREGGAESAMLPTPLYEKILATPGWVPVCEE